MRARGRRSRTGWGTMRSTTRSTTCAGAGAGKQVVLVSSGAVALGRPRLNLPANRPLRLDEKQAAAAVGQTLMIQAWDQAFSEHGFHAAQALLSRSRPAVVALGGGRGLDTAVAFAEGLTRSQAQTPLH